MLLLLLLSILAINFNLLTLVNDESFLLFSFLSLYYFIVARSMRMTIQLFIFKKIWKIYDKFNILYWIHTYIVFLDTVFFIYLKKLLKALKSSKKYLLRKKDSLINAFFFLNKYFLNLKIESLFSNLKNFNNLLLNILSTLINVDKIFILKRAYICSL